MPQYSTFFHLKKAALPKQLPAILFQGRLLSEKGLESTWLIGGIKVLVLLLMVYFIRQKILQGLLSFEEIATFGKEIFRRKQAALLLIPFLLVPVNWGLEAKKWQLLANPVTKLSLLQAMRAVVTGLSLGFVTPRSIGDYAGRILEAPVKDRSTLVGAVLLNRVSQSFITYLAGLSGLLYILVSVPGETSTLWLWLSPLLILGAGASFFLLSSGRHYLLKLARRFKGLRAAAKLFQIIGMYTRHNMICLVLYAFLRYCVFSFQFVLVLWLAGINLPVQVLFAGVAVVFMLKSVIPAFNFLSDLGVREFSALLVFSVYQVPETLLVTASLLVWSLNILLPTILGSINIVRLRINPSPC